MYTKKSAGWKNHPADYINHSFVLLTRFYKYYGGSTP